MWTHDSPRDRPRAADLYLSGCCLLAFLVACSGGEGAGGESGPASGTQPGSGALESPVARGSGDPGGDPGGGSAPEDGPTKAELPDALEVLVEALGATPLALAIGVDESLREPSDPQDWPSPATVGGEPVRIIREFHPTAGTLLRIASARPQLAEGASPILHGPEWRFHESGATRSVQWWKDDVPHGPMKQWRPVGMLAREGVFSDGQRDGLWRVFAKNGQLIEQSVYRDGVPEGLHRAWYPSGQEKEREAYKGGKLDGERKSWGREGLLVLSETYEGGVLNGRWSDFHPGTSQPRQWGDYRAGKRHGIWLRGSAGGGTLSSASYTDGTLNGLVRSWSEGGTLIEEITYLDGEKTGRSASWYADGSPQSEGELENGRRIGRWTYWKSDGALNERWSGVFEDDERVAPLEPEPGSPRPPRRAPR